MTTSKRSFVYICELLFRSSGVCACCPVGLSLLGLSVSTMCLPEINDWSKDNFLLLTKQFSLSSKNADCLWDIIVSKTLTKKELGANEFLRLSILIKLISKLIKKKGTEIATKKCTVIFRNTTLLPKLIIHSKARSVLGSLTRYPNDTSLSKYQYKNKIISFRWLRYGIERGLTKLRHLIYYLSLPYFELPNLNEFRLDLYDDISLIYIIRASRELLYEAASLTLLHRGVKYSSNEICSIKRIILDLYRFTNNLNFPVMAGAELFDAYMDTFTSCYGENEYLISFDVMVKCVKWYESRSGTEYAGKTWDHSACALRKPNMTK